MADRPVQPRDEASAIIQALYRQGPQATAEWIEANIDQMDPSTASTVVAWFAGQRVQGGGSYLNLDKGSRTSRFRYGATDLDANAAQDAAKTEQVGLDAQAQAAVQAAGSGAQVSYDLNQDGYVSAGETKAVSKALAGVPADPADGEGPSREDVESNFVVSDSIAVPPAWLAELLGGPPDRTMVGNLISEWNAQNPDAPVSDAQGLYKAMAISNDPQVQTVTEKVVYGLDPVMDYRVTVLGGKTVTIQSEQYEAALKHFQGDFNPQELTYFVRMADRIGLEDGTGQVAWQPLAAIAKALGYTTESATGFNPNQMAKADPRHAGPDGESPNMPYMTGQAYRLQQAAVRYQEALKQYGNTGLAFLATFDPALASRLATTNFDDWAAEDKLTANNWLIRGGWASENTNLGEMGYSTQGTPLADLATKGNGGLGSGSEPERQLPDPVQMRQAARDLYMALYLTEPSDEQLSGFVSTVMGQVKGAADNQTIDVGARLRDLIENDGAHRELYGAMPGGMTESEYQQQFRSGARSMVGDEAVDPGLIQSGMRTGDYQTTVGQAAVSKKAWGNSTFLGRLATAAQVVAQNT